MEVPSPLNQNIVRGLSDKLYDKRKAAALEIERIVRELANQQDIEPIRNITAYLVREFAFAPVPNSKNGGLIGLAAIAIALGSEVDDFLDDIIPPVLACFAEQDAKVRYFACEAMYNIAKVAKTDVLRFFNEIFDALSKLVSDSDLPTKNGAGLLDRLMKDIISELSIDTHPAQKEIESSTGPINPYTRQFSLPRFIPLLSERVKTVNPFTRTFLVGWISILNSIPDLELVTYLPRFLEGLLKFLADPNSDVATAAQVLFSDFLRDIRDAARVTTSFPKETEVSAVNSGESIPDLASSPQSPPLPQLPETQSSEEIQASSALPSTPVSIEEATTGSGKGLWFPGQGVHIDYSSILELLLPHITVSPTGEEPLQAMALRWANDFAIFAKPVVLSFAPKLVSAVLPCLAHERNNIVAIARELNSNLYHLVYETKDFEPGKECSIDYHKMVNLLTLQLLHEHEATRVESLEWLIMLHSKAKDQLFRPGDGMFPALLKVLSDPSEEVVKRDLQLLAQISSHADVSKLQSAESNPAIPAIPGSNQTYFRTFMVNLLSLFSTDRRLLEHRGALIIRQLCATLHSETIYRSLAVILENDKDLEFAGMMVQHLNIILITAPELGDLRRKLKRLTQKDGQSLFVVLYRSWCHSPVAAFALCLLSQAYEHATALLNTFAEIEITVPMLIQIDKLVQLLESPIFTYLRLQLLEPEKYPYLFKSLYGLLMLLPQSSAFSTLKNRLSCVSTNGFVAIQSISNLSLSTVNSPGKSSEHKKNKPDLTFSSTLKFSELLSHFRSVQAQHEKSRRNINSTLSTHHPNQILGFKQNLDTLPNISDEAPCEESNSNTGAPLKSAGGDGSRRLSPIKSKQSRSSIRRVDSPLSHLRQQASSTFSSNPSVSSISDQKSFNNQ